MVLEDLWDGENCFDGEADVADCCYVGGRAGDEGKEYVDEEEGRGEVGEREEIWSTRTPLPESKRPFPFHQELPQYTFLPRTTTRPSERRMSNPTLLPHRRAIVQRNFQQDDLYHDHEACLNEQGLVVVCTEPVEYFQYRRNEHDERYIQAEPIT